MPRFTIDVDDKFNAVLTDLADGGSKADVIRKAVATYKLLKSEVRDPLSGNQVAISNASGQVEKVVILP